MGLLTAISISSLVVSIAAVVFVLGLYEELEKSESETPKVHTQELNETMVRSLMEHHVQELAKAADLTERNWSGVQSEKKIEGYAILPEFNCLWTSWYDQSGEYNIVPRVFAPGELNTYNYNKTDDIWLATSSRQQCQGIKTWTIDDNTGEITYGRPDDK